MPFIADVFVNDGSPTDARAASDAEWINIVKRALGLRLRGVLEDYRADRISLDGGVEARNCATLVCLLSPESVVAPQFLECIESFVAANSGSVPAVERMF